MNLVSSAFKMMKKCSPGKIVGGGDNKKHGSFVSIRWIEISRLGYSTFEMLKQLGYLVIYFVET